MEKGKQLYTLDEGEEILHQTKHHPIGIAPLVIGTGVLGVSGVVAVFAIGPIISTLGINAPRVWLILVVVTVLALAVLMTYVSVKVYFKSHLIITNQSIIEVNQFSLFSRDVSQLSLANVQEVTVQQSGLLASMFDFGTVTLETAGEKANFRFEKAPNPYYISRVIYDAHERFIETHPEFTSRQ